jgi:hypothetical protein
MADNLYRTGYDQSRNAGRGEAIQRRMEEGLSMAKTTAPQELPPDEEIGTFLASWRFRAISQDVCVLERTWTDLRALAQAYSAGGVMVLLRVPPKSPLGLWIRRRLRFQACEIKEGLAHRKGRRLRPEVCDEGRRQMEIPEILAASTIKSLTSRAKGNGLDIPEVPF